MYTDYHDPRILTRTHILRRYSTYAPVSHSRTWSVGLFSGRYKDAVDLIIRASREALVLALFAV